MKKVFLALAFFLLLSGCSEPTPQAGELPSDFEASYSSSAMHIEWGSTQISLDYGGRGRVKKTMGMEMEIEKEFSCTKEELQEIYNAVVANRFFSLQSNYEDPMVMDGGIETLSIKAGGESKTVTVVNMYVEQFDAVSSAIYSLANSKVNLITFDFKNSCDSKKTECSGSDSLACEEWAYFCDWENSAPFEISAKYCAELRNRENCVAYCSTKGCPQEICDALVFEADGCTECGPGCCEKCSELDSCFSTNGCEVAWVHPSGESWQFGRCYNTDFCPSQESLCDYIQTSYEGFAYEASVEEDFEKAGSYSETADSLEALYNESC